VLPLLRLLRLLTLLDVLNRRAANSLRGRVAGYLTGASGLVIFCSALAVLDAERADPRANLTTFGDAVWWSITTVTTVGYGDHYPTTSIGRLVVVLLMVGGVALLGIVTAGLASWLIDRIQEVEAESRTATRRDLARLSAELEALRRELRLVQASGEQGPAEQLDRADRQARAVLTTVSCPMASLDNRSAATGDRPLRRRPGGHYDAEIARPCRATRSSVIRRTT